MDATREAAKILAKQGRIVITQKGQVRAATTPALLA